MKLEKGKKYLITTSDWFYAPNGNCYRAVFGTVHGINTDEEVLGIKTNRSSTNWYVLVGNMMVAGCRIHYCVQTDFASFEPPIKEIIHEGKLITEEHKKSHIYFA